MIGVPPRFHGVVRGLEKIQSSPQFEGRFGRMFRTLPAARFTEEDLRKLAAQMIAEAEETPTPEDEDDEEENPNIPAGYTYLGQFIDHDLTFDPNSSLQKQNDPDGLVDFRTPRFDLDCVYGRGPDDQPYFYEDDGLHFLLGGALNGNHDAKARDLPRNSSAGRKRALIGDPRNDENVIVSQLQAIFLRFHNRVVDFLKGTDAIFYDVQRFVRWHYQWVVLHDFLPKIIGTEMLESILPHLKHNTSIFKDKPVLRFYRFEKDPFIPVEFSVAAYRFGHSMVRPVYRLNTANTTTPPPDGRFPIFPDLVGFGEFPAKLAIDWSLFFDFGNNPPEHGPTRIQPSYRIDSSVVNPLGNLPAVIGKDIPSLAFRNLVRGWRMGLPSGQDVARAMGVEPIEDDELRVGVGDEEENPLLTSLSPAFRNNAPLWYYILAEAAQQKEKHLGPVGGRIVGEVFVGLMLGDRHSYLNQDPTWKPFQDFMNKGKFMMADLIQQAMKV